MQSQFTGRRSQLLGRPSNDGGDGTARSHKQSIAFSMSVVSGVVEVPSMSILGPFALTQVGVQPEAARADRDSRAGDAESAIGDGSFQFPVTPDFMVTYDS